MTSPALSASTKILEKIAYGVAIPTIVIAGVINGHVAAVSGHSTQIHVDVRLSRTAEIYICANVPQLGAPGLALVVRDVCLDAHHHGAVDRRVGYRQCDSRV